MVTHRSPPVTRCRCYACYCGDPAVATRVWYHDRPLDAPMDAGLCASDLGRGRGMTSLHACRLCDADLTRTFVDLGMSPLCESYVPAERLDQAEIFYPLHVRLCGSCLLVQIPAYVTGEQIFSDYAYFSSYSDSWVAHAKRYADGMIGSLGLTSGSLVTEVASNDGSLLQHFVGADVPVLGVEPAGNVAEAAIAKGIRTVVEFLGPDTG